MKSKRGVDVIQYALPDLTKHLAFSLTIVKMMHAAPEMFYDDIEISSIYGNFPGCIMNGGRLCRGERYSYGQIEEVLGKISDEGLIPRLTFTNMLIRPEHFEDDYSNMILKLAQKYHAQIIINSDELGNYISTNYGLGLILSTTRALNGVGELNKMLDRYSMVVLDYNHNKDDEYLSKVNDPSRLEVMPNELCAPGCLNRQNHYMHLSRCQLENIAAEFNCPYDREKEGFSTRTASSPTLLSNGDIRRLNTTYGISHFKIVGRLESWLTTTESYTYYLARPEYRSVILKIAKKSMQHTMES